MATELRLRGGTTAQHASFTGATKEITVDTTKNTVVVHNGSTAGGVPLATESDLTSEVNSSVHAPGTGLPNEIQTYFNNTLTSTSTEQALTAAQGKVLKDELDVGFTKAIGETFNLATHLTGIVEPSNADDAKFVKLTAGLDGAGQFNEGLLINETITGSGATIEITAEIATGPLAGNVINLLNSENRYLMPGENSGAVADDQMQQITGSSQGAFLNDSRFSGSITNGAITTVAAAPGTSTSISNRAHRVDFNSANSPDARTGDHTNVKHIEATYYMRIA